VETAHAITAEQAKFIHANQPPAVLGGTVVVLLVAFVFWEVVPRDYLLAWVGVIVVVTAVRMWIWHSYRARTFTLAVSRRWLRIAVAGAGLSGVLWGAGSLFLIPPGELAYQLIFLWAVSMMAVASMFSYSAHVPTYMAYFLPATLTTLAVLLLQGTAAHYSFVAGMLLYVVVVVRFVATYNKMFFEAQKLRFQNVDLVGQLTDQIAVAKSASLAKSRFLAAASHDLRQPMHALNLYLGGLTRQEMSAPARDTLGHAAQCAQTMDGMFRALLDISRLDAGSMQPETRAFALAPLLERIRVEHEPQARGKGIELRVARSSAWVRADPVFLDRILRNLTSNAVRYTERGRILIGCRRGPGVIRLEVHDTGAGIPPAEQRLVFEEFYQAGNPGRDRSRGMGLGLAIVDRLARLMQARVGLDSEPGRGSRFSLEVPQAPAAEPVAAPLARAARARRRRSRQPRRPPGRGGRRRGDDPQRDALPARAMALHGRDGGVGARGGRAARQQHARARRDRVRLPPRRRKRARGDRRAALGIQRGHPGAADHRRHRPGTAARP
jgi:signal transduction histidine kinase